MIKTYNDLSSSTEPDIFEINKHQKYILNWLIHYASKIGMNIKSGMQTNTA